MLILDDLMQEAVQSPQVTQLLTRGTHHLELFAITLMQNLYPGGREQATQNRNYHYTVLFRNPADTRYVKALGNRWMGDSQAFWELYKNATAKPYGYLLIDNHPRSEEAIRFRTHLLVDESSLITVLQPAQRSRRKLKKWVGNDNEEAPVAHPVPTGPNKELICNDGWVINKNDGKKRHVG